MSEDGAESWDEEQMNEWEHDRWLMIQEMGNDFYKDDQDEKVDPFEEEERVKWKEEEEKAKASYLKMIKEEEEKGYFRQTVAELVEERSEAKKLRRELEMKKKETVKEANKPKQNDEETDVSKSNLDKEQADDDEREKEATSFTDSSLPQESNLTSVQAVDEAEQREVDGTTQELDKGLEGDDTDQVTEDHFDDKKAGERDEEGEEGKKRAPKASKLKTG